MITGSFGFRVNLNPFSIEPYGVRYVDGKPVEELKFISAPELGQPTQDASNDRSKAGFVNVHDQGNAA